MPLPRLSPTQNSSGCFSQVSMRLRMADGLGMEGEGSYVLIPKSRLRV